MPKLLETVEKSLGKNVPRADAPEKVKGEPVYCGDLSLPNMLHGGVLRSRYPHARIVSVDTAAARALPGVAAVAVGSDVPGLNILGDHGDQPVLCVDKVRFIGDAVAAVAAETAEIAAQALELITVEYEELPAVYDPVEAMKAEAPRVHEGQDNLVRQFKVRKGDAESAFGACDVVVENIYETPIVEHAYLETEAAVALKNPDGKMTVWASTQFALLCRNHVSVMLGVPPEQVRVINMNPGGGFGGKGHEFDCACRAALLAYLTGRPVKLVYDRPESIISSSKRHAVRIEYKTGASRDGRIQAVQARVYMNKGAYGSVAIEPGMPIVTRTGAHAGGPYDIPNVSVDVYSVYTNLPFGGAMRGFGVPQAAFAHESQIDMLAERLGMDPVELRLLNGVEVGSMTVMNKVAATSVGLKTSIRQAAERAGWKQFRANKPSGGKILRGMGMGAFFYLTGIAAWPTWANCTFELDSSGQIVVRTGIVDMGQGARTVLAQIAADAIGIPVEYVVCSAHGDTDTEPDSQLTAASRGTIVAGNAIIQGAPGVRQALLSMAADCLDMPVDRVEQFEDGFGERGGSRAVSVKDLLAYCYKCGRRMLGHGWWCIDKHDESLIPCSYGAQIVEVAVNTETGEVKLERVVHAQDVGRALNPDIVEAQIQGSIVMALGHSLSEELVVNDGRVANASLANYLLPTAGDIPPIETIIVEEPDARGPFGAKGVAEPATAPTAAAIANAIFDATGIRITELPITAERVWRSLREQAPKGQAAAVQS